MKKYRLITLILITLIPSFAGTIMGMSNKNEKELETLRKEFGEEFKNDLVKYGKRLVKLVKNEKHKTLVKEIMTLGKFVRKNAEFAILAQQEKHEEAAKLAPEIEEGHEKIKRFVDKLENFEKESEQIKNFERSRRLKKRTSLVLTSATLTGAGLLTLPFWKNPVKTTGRRLLQKFMLSWYRSK